MVLLPLVAGLTACDDFSLLSGPQEKGELRWVLDKSILTKSGAEIPDTNDFILTIRDARGEILYDGTYGDSPESLAVEAGSYTIGVVSIPFTTPAFARPQYGDEQVIVVASGQSVTVRLTCTLLNAGIRLKIAPEFLTSYPDGVLFVKQGSVKLKYAYTEKRIAYVMPDAVSVLLYNNAKEETLFTRELAPREVLSISIMAPEPGSGGQGTSAIRIAVDTSKVWTRESFVIGGDNGDAGNGGQVPENALSVAEASAHIGEEDIWVYGYIVGGDLTSSGKTVKTENWAKNTHLAIADRSSVTAKSSCLAVELPKGSVRDALNLVEHPDLRGCRVYLKGNLVESYFGTVGLKGTKDFVLK